MECKMETASATIYTKDDLSQDLRTQILDQLKSRKGVGTASNRNEKAKIFIVHYRPKEVTAHDLLQVVLDTGVHAKMVG